MYAAVNVLPKVLYVFFKYAYVHAIIWFTSNICFDEHRRECFSVQTVFCQRPQ